MTKPQNRRITGLIEAGKPTRFQRGQSGNPGGRPSTKLLTDALRRRLALRIPSELANRLKLRTTATYGEAIASELIRQALKGNVAAAKEIADRCEGRVSQALQFDSGGSTLKIALESDQAVVDKLLGAASEAGVKAS